MADTEREVQRMVQECRDLEAKKAASDQELRELKD
jgi:hypothetical protein